MSKKFDPHQSESRADLLVFISLVQALYYVGFIQWFVRKFAGFVFWAMGVSGAEAIVAAATPFIGQGKHFPNSLVPNCIANFSR